MKCRNCGATLDEGALFCRKCGTAVLKETEPKKTGFFQAALLKIKTWVQKTKTFFSGGFKNRRLLPIIGIAAALLIVLIVVIVCFASCKKPARFSSPDEVKAAVVTALETGDGDRLAALSKTAEPILGLHPEVYGEGESSEAVMEEYYRRLATDIKETLSARFGKQVSLEAVTQTRIAGDSQRFEANRALNIEASQYATLTGPLTVGGETVKYLCMVAAELNGEWKLMVVYLSDSPIS